jgi:hypothetical protein
MFSCKKGTKIPSVAFMQKMFIDADPSASR